MTPISNQPARFRLKDDQAELARLKRLTGLDFDTVPESLLHLVEGPRAYEGALCEVPVRDLSRAQRN